MEPLSQLSSPQAPRKFPTLTTSVAVAVIAIITAYNNSSTVRKAINPILEPVFENFVPIYHEGDSEVPYLPSLF